MEEKFNIQGIKLLGISHLKEEVESEKLHGSIPHGILESANIYFAKAFNCWYQN